MSVGHDNLGSLFDNIQMQMWSKQLVIEVQSLEKKPGLEIIKHSKSLAYGFYLKPGDWRKSVRE